MSGKDLLLLTVQRFSSQGATPVQIQKATFLMQQNFPHLIKNKYKFVPYNYGPFDAKIYKDLQGLVNFHLLGKKSSNNMAWRRYVVTDSGVQASLKVSETVDKDVLNYLDTLVKWMKDLTFEELVSSIYKQYPAYKMQSIFKG